MIALYNFVASKGNEPGGIKKSHVLDDVTLENVELKGDFVDVDQK